MSLDALVTVGKLRIALDRSSPGTLRVDFTGRSASREAGKALAPVLDALLGEARACGAALSLHFQALDYFNSSTIAAIVRFLRASEEAGIVTTLVYDGRQRWQALSFDTLRRELRPLEAAGGRTAVRFVALPAQASQGARPE